MVKAEKQIVFDVVGTLVSYDFFFEAIESRLGEKLRAECIKPKLLGFAWMEAAEREYTYMSMSGKYTVFFDVFGPLFYRMLWMAGIQEPRKFATDEDKDYILAAYRQLKLRPGAVECVEKLRAAGFTVWAFTAGDIARVGAYFKSGGIEMPAENLLSCDTLGVGKPASEAYRPLLEQFGVEKSGGVGHSVWFGAAHMWDVSAAKRTGFRGAYCSIWENEPCVEIFGKMDVMAPTLPEMADQVIAASQ